jgi:O-antigen/teichoic acid export membrane protein
MIWFLVPVLFGAEFLDSRELILPLVLGSGVYGISRLGVGVATARGADKAVNMINILGMITSVLLYLWLIPSGGALGAAWASFGGYALSSVAGAAYLINLGCMSSNGKRVLRLKEPR